MKGSRAARSSSSDRLVGQRAGQHGELRVDLPADFAEQRLDRCGHVGALEQIAQVGIVAFFVEMHDVHARTSMPLRFRTWTCTAASARCSSFCDDDDFTSVM